MAASSEAGAEAETEQLRLVEILLDEGFGQIHPDSAERRHELGADTQGGPDRAGVAFFRTVLVEVPDAADVGADEGTHAQILGQAGREGHHNAADIVLVAAQDDDGLDVPRLEAGLLAAP